MASPNANQTSVGGGNPINFVTASKYQQDTDLPALPGVLGLEIVRHHNSVHANAATAPGLVGRGWRLSYETRLQIEGDRIFVLQADGGRVIFSRDARNPSLCASADPADGTLQVDERSARIDTTYTWTWAGPGEGTGRRLIFDAVGKLLRIEAPTGEVLHLEYDGHRRLTRVIDPQGRRLTLNYPAPGAPRSGVARAFEGVVSIDSPVGRFVYRYGSETGKPLPAAAAELVATLREVTSPDALRRIYHHEDERHPMLLTGISVVGDAQRPPSTPERIATYGYDAEGRAVLSVRGPLPREGESGSDLVRITAYRRPVGMAPGFTEIVNSLGQPSRYETRVIGGHARLVRSSGVGCASCPAVPMRWTYDERGRLRSAVRLDRDGRPSAGQRWELDGAGRVVAEFEQHFDALGRVAETLTLRHGYQGAQREPAWTEKPSVVAGEVQRIEMERNASGQLTRITQRGFSPIDPQGQPKPTPIERSITHTYATIQGRSVPIAGTTPAGRVQADWSPDGTRIVKWIDPAGASRFEYDAAGRIHRVQDEQGVTTEFTLDASGQALRVLRSGPGWTHPQTSIFKRDASGRVIETGVGEGLGYRATQAQGFDVAGHIVWQAQALGLLHTRRHDTEGQLIEAGLMDGAMRKVSTFGHAPDGQWAFSRDNSGRQRSAVFDARSGQAVGLVDEMGRLHGPLAQAGRADQRADQRLQPVEHVDDWGRRVQTVSPDSGTTTRRFDAADRLIGMVDALGNTATYAYDGRGRIVRQEVVPAAQRGAAASAAVTTRWTYEGSRLISVQHPTQDERYAYDARGLRTARAVTIKSAGRHHTAVTRYGHDERGDLQWTSLPDGSRLTYRRNGQRQIVALQRAAPVSRWLHGLSEPQELVRDLQRDLVGLKAMTAGNGVRTLHQRSDAAELARTLHLAPPRSLTAFGDGPALRERMGRATVSAIDAMLGISPAQAATLDPAAAMSAPSAGRGLPGALGLPEVPGALTDHRYLWDAGGNLLLMQDPDRRSAYAYDARDRLIVAQTQATTTGHLTTVRQAADGTPLERLARYHYDAQDRRVLSQELRTPQAVREADAAGASADAATRSIAYEPGTHRQRGLQHDAAGQPARAGDGRRLRWDALGRLTAVETAEGKVQARYTYDHRGLRIAKTVGHITTHYLYDDGRNLMAELDGEGVIRRQYVHLASMPVAVIDGAHRLAGDGDGLVVGLGELLAGLGRLTGLVGQETLAFLHLNHLGAPELATDERAQVIWRADYQADGRATTTSRPGSSFELDLRLPGQLADAESGLHYNRARYYDPAQGAYLTPDPLGTPDGPNGYAYVAFNPLRFVDPAGLQLFAFDGTENTDDAAWLRAHRASASNVLQFYRGYDQASEGKAYYITGVGTDYQEIKANDQAKYFGLVPDAAVNTSGPKRIDRMVQYFRHEVYGNVKGRDVALNIDIVGFSRGAAQARDFSNQISKASFALDEWNGALGQNQPYWTEGIVREGGKLYYRWDTTAGVYSPYPKRSYMCQLINFRFMGLWDTVLSVNDSGRDYNFSIPDVFARVAHAVALNEHRSAPSGYEPGLFRAIGNIGFWNGTRAPLPGDRHMGGFELHSIGRSDATAGHVRIELGFLGSHADIGGGYAPGENGLATVAAHWMARQAVAAGLKTQAIPKIDMNNPVVHDQSNVLRVGDPHLPGVPERLRETLQTRLEDREVKGSPDGATRQRGMTFGGGPFRSLTFADTAPLIRYDDRPAYNLIGPLTDNEKHALSLRHNRTGTVDMAGYLDWLKRHGKGYFWSGPGG